MVALSRISCFSLLCLLINIHTCTAQQVPVEGYHLVWKDEFDGTKLDRSKWNFRGIGHKRGDSYNSEQAAHLDGKGHLLLMAKMSNDSVLNGMLDTEHHFEVRYGYFECRAKLHSIPGAWSAFWLQSRKNIDNGTPETNGAEIDIFEYFPHERRDTVTQSLHWGGYGKSHRVEGPILIPLARTADDFHTFGLEWTKDGYKTFVDGKLTFQGDQLVSKVPQFVILSLLIDKNVAGPLPRQSLPDSFIIDYVRVYQK